MNEKDFNAILGYLADMNKARDRAAALLNVKPSDINKALAVEFEARGLQSRAFTDKHGNTTLFTYKASTADTLTVDTDAVKAEYAARGAVVPMKCRKGAAATIIVK